MKTNLMNMNTLRSTFGTLFVAVFAVAVFSVAPLAHAQFDGSGDFSGDCCGGSDLIDAGYSYDSVPDYSSNLIDAGYSYSSTPDYSSNLMDAGYSYPSDYLSSDYLTSSYMTGGYGFSGGSMGYSVPFSYGGGGGYNSSSVYAPTNTWDNGNTSIYAPSQTNTCTAGNSCNTNIVTNTTNPTPVVYNTPTYNPQPYYPAPNYNTCNTCGCIGYPVCNPVVYNSNPTPYITLSQVPYTGLDLGFWGTIAYWGFFIFWCLAAAYLIVVKKVQNKIYRALNKFLFGTTEVVEDVKQETALDVNALASQIASILNPQFSSANGAPAASVKSVNQFEDKTDDFVLSQINRPLR